MKSNSSTRPVLVFTGNVLLVIGLVAVGTGLLWAKPGTDLLTGYAITSLPELYFPYWPFEPYLPVFIIALGVLLTTKTKT